MEIKLEDKYKVILKEAMDDYIYKVSLQLNEMKGQSMTDKRKELTDKQRYAEKLRKAIK